ncbi:MAG: sensor histidine kinase [Crocinitomicaceae bacterium]
MFNFLKAPLPADLDLYETTRMRMTWNMHLLLILALTAMTCIAANNQSIYVLFYGGSLFLILLSLVIIKRTGEFGLTSACVSTIIYLGILYSMFQIDGYIHYLEPFWALLVGLYVYFSHGKAWGGLTMITTVICTALFFLFRLNGAIEVLRSTDSVKLLSKGIEFAICLSLIGYIIHQFIFLKNHAEKELRLMNQALRKEKELVESRDQEKTILLQEIHHRVKNNLQIVTSLLRMQSNKITSPETKEHFNDAINRVLTMSLIHQKLYESENLSAIDFSEYIESLTADVLRSSPIQRNIEKSISIDVPEIGMKTIVPIALIITELISNSMKHAFKTTASPHIKLSAHSNADADSLEFTYSDNGAWKESNTETFGMQLIEALTEQLEGSYTLQLEESGSTYSFQFKRLD